MQPHFGQLTSTYGSCSSTGEDFGNRFSQWKQCTGIGTLKSARVRTSLAGFTELRRLSRDRFDDFHPALAAVAIHPRYVGAVSAVEAEELAAVLWLLVWFVTPGTGQDDFHALSPTAS
jgi:hypothetical protein